MRRHFLASRVNNGQHDLPPGLEARIRVLESAASDTDFDAPSWIWMALFGILLPVVLIVLGW
jgi:hypothetical protein